MRIFVFLISLLIIPFSLNAQEDKDFLTRFLQDSLSGAGRTVQITGFAGALSSQATIQVLTIADTKGVWLTLKDVELDWDRLATLAGHINITKLSAAEIHLPRQPIDETPLSPETQPFALPDLPVSIKIGAIEAKRVVLGKALLGQSATFSVQGNLSLADGEGDANLALKRLDGPLGQFALQAKYTNATRALSINLDATEAASGLIAGLLNLPGAPALELTVAGDGPLDDFSMDLALRSDGKDRLRGKVSVTNDATQSDPAMVFALDVFGDVTPLFIPEYQAFFGTEVGLKTNLAVYPDGRISLSTLSVDTAALKIVGDISIDANGVPDHFALEAQLESASGNAVLLPLSGPQIKIQKATIIAAFDATTSQNWTIGGTVNGFNRAETAVQHITLNASGDIHAASPRAVKARIDIVTDGIALSDPAMQQAIGHSVRIGSLVSWHEDKPIHIVNVDITSDDLKVFGAATVQNYVVSGHLQAAINDLSRLSLLAQQPLQGRAKAMLDGTFEILSGAFDLDLSTTGTALVFDAPKINALAGGAGTITASAKRDASGLVLRDVQLRTQALDIHATGRLATADGDITFTAVVDDLKRVLPDISGPLVLEGRAAKTVAGWAGDIDIQGPDATLGKITVTLPLNGPTKGALDISTDIIARFVPAIVGQTTLKAQLSDEGASWRLAAKVSGPQNANASIAGTINKDFKVANLSASGDVSLALINRQIQPRALQGRATFDLITQGPLALGSLTGNIQTTSAHLALPNLQTALSDLSAHIQLENGRAGISLEGHVPAGGTVSANGSIGLTAPYTSDILIHLENTAVRYSRLLQSTATGDLAFVGPITAGTAKLSGQISLGTTDINIQSSGAGALDALPPITHINDTKPVRVTRQKAGITAANATTPAGPDVPLALDIAITAPNQIFVRGLGLDAEFGGTMRISGQPTNIKPTGEFNLVRGRMSLLGKRFDLSEGRIWMEGGLIPSLAITADHHSETGKYYIVVEGQADKPDIRFLSEPEQPEDEVLAQILFGKDITKISALQAAQMASAVATLSGGRNTGFMSRLRQKTGIDDIDITTDSEGNSGLRLGKYINDRVYTNVELGSQGESTINLNLDLSKSVTVKGRYGLGSNGAAAESGVGVYFQKDY